MQNNRESGFYNRGVFLAFVFSLGEHLLAVAAATPLLPCFEGCERIHADNNSGVTLQLFFREPARLARSAPRHRAPCLITKSDHRRFILK